MHSTKTEILAHLKRNHGATVEELTSSLSLAPMTVRQHLTALERDGAVTAREVRRPNGGRPHFLFSLTDEGHRRLSAGYDRLVALLVREAGVLDASTTDPDERRRQLFRLAAASLADRYRAETIGLSGENLAERLTRILRDHGGFAEWHNTGGEIELRDINCVFRANVSHDGACDWHQTFFSRILETPIDAVEREGCADCCTYVIPARSLPASNGSTP